MITPRFSKIQLTLWGAALVLFGLLSMLGLLVGPQLVHGIAVRFHENNIATALEADEYPVAAKELKAWQWIEPDNEAVTLQLAEVHLLLDEWMEARERLQPLLENMSTDQYPICRLMSLAESGAESSESQDWAKRAADCSSPDHATEVDLLMAHSARKSGQADEARALYTRLAESYSDHDEAHYHLAKYAEETGDIAGIREHLGAISVDTDGYPYTPEYISRQVKAANDITRLEAMFKNSTPQTGPRLEALGIAYLETGNWQQAMGWLERASTAGGATWQTDYWLAINKEISGDRKGAFEGYRNAVLKNPKASIARRQVRRLMPGQ